VSAYIVNKAHIDAMVTAAVQGRDIDWLTYWHNGQRHDVRPETASAFGQMLLDANVASVAYRYPNDALTDLPGPVNAYYVLPYRFEQVERSPIEVLHGIACYEYQSCETDEWETSEAHAAAQALRAHVVTMLPGYDATPWDIAA
jgi:hypothetical protein